MVSASTALGPGLPAGTDVGNRRVHARLTTPQSATHVLLVFDL